MNKAKIEKLKEAYKKLGKMLERQDSRMEELTEDTADEMDNYDIYMEENGKIPNFYVDEIISRNRTVDHVDKFSQVVDKVTSGVDSISNYDLDSILCIIHPDNKKSKLETICTNIDFITGYSAEKTNMFQLEELGTLYRQNGVSIAQLDSYMLTDKNFMFGYLKHVLSPSTKIPFGEVKNKIDELIAIERKKDEIDC